MPLYDDESYLTSDEAEQVLRTMLTEFDVLQEQSFPIGSVTFTVIALDHGEEEQAYRAVGRDDMMTRVLSLKREELKRAITKINGNPVKPDVLDRFIKRADPILVDQIYAGYKALRKAQALSWERLADGVKK